MNLIDFHKRFPNEDACVEYFKTKRETEGMSERELKFFGTIYDCFGETLTKIVFYMYLYILKYLKITWVFLTFPFEFVKKFKELYKKNLEDIKKGDINISLSLFRFRNNYASIQPITSSEPHLFTAQFTKERHCHQGCGDKGYQNNTFIL